MNRYLIIFVAAFALAACGRNDDTASAADSTDSQAHGEMAVEAGYTKGTHGGRLLTDGNLGVEITIFERGVPPEFRVYIYRDNKPIADQQVTLTVALSRLGGRVDVFSFMPVDAYFLGKGEVEEPHSFDVKVVATVDGKAHEWHYESPEGRTTIDADTAKASGIRVAIAGPATLRERLSLYGTIEANTERVRQVSARYPGVVRSVKHQIGDRVPAGAVLATVESNESLQTYSVTAPIAGVVTQRMANVGESTGDAPLFVVTDLSTVWAELSVFPRDRNLLAAGQEVQVVATDGGQSAPGRIAWISPVGGAGQPLAARLVLDNRAGKWTPGMFVNGEVTVGKKPVSLAVPLTAVQSLRDWKVVFANVGDVYEARPLVLGRDDGEWVEVTGGHLAVGDQYVSEHSFLVKADIEKSGASHDH